MTLQWLSWDPRTGRTHADLPALVPDYPLRRSIGQYDTATATFYLDKAADNWLQATEPMGAVLGVYDDTDLAKSIQWAGLVTSRTRTGSADSAKLSLMTCEGYLDRRKIVTDTTLTGLPQGTIVANLIASFVADAGGLFGLTVAWSGTPNTVRDVTYLAADFASIYQRVTELAAADGGFEWTLDWGWSGNLLVPTLQMSPRLGVSPIAGLQPDAVFEMPGCLVDATITEDCTDGKYASRVRAYSSGQGIATPASDLHAATTNKLRADYAWQPAPNIDGDPAGLASLDAYAAKAVAFLAPGANSATLTAALNHKGTPLVGRDWKLGDDVLGIIAARDASDRPSRAFPGGWTGVGRAIAYEITESTLSPILAVPSLQDAA